LSYGSVLLYFSHILNIILPFFEKFNKKYLGHAGVQFSQCLDEIKWTELTVRLAGWQVNWVSENKGLSFSLYTLKRRK